MCTVNTIFDTSFLNLYFKLTQFTMLYYTCLVPGGKVYTIRNRVTARHDCLDFRNYFIGERDSRPACTCLFSAGIEIDCDEMEDELMSSKNVTLNERLYKDIVVFKNGTRFSLTDNHTECFEGKDNFISFEVYVL